MSKALVVFSGGQDSTTCLFWALKKFDEVETLCFDYGQRHRIEARSCTRHCRKGGRSVYFAESGFAETNYPQFA